LVTHIFVEGDPQIEVSSVLGVKDSLIKSFTHQPPGTPMPGERDLGDRPWTRTRFDNRSGTRREKFNNDIRE
jgi:hypothetical protein